MYNDCLAYAFSDEKSLPWFICDTYYEIYFPEINMGLGELPKAYSKAVHGPYDPAVFYGKKDVPLGQVSEIQINCLS